MSSFCFYTCLYILLQLLDPHSANIQPTLYILPDTSVLTLPDYLANLCPIYLTFLLLRYQMSLTHTHMRNTECCLVWKQRRS